MTSKLTREQAQQIIDAADAVISALAGTNDEVHKDDTDKMVHLWDDLNDRYAPPEVVRELASMALAAMDSEPVIADCDPEVYEKGVSACLVVIPKETAEVICKGISAATGCKVDWHYIGGRVHIKALQAAPQPAPVVDSEPVILYRQVNPVNGMKTYWAELDPEEFRHLKQHTDENAEFMTLYRYAQPAPERDQVRREHAEWSQATFGDVGPVGPLKHLSKEALEAAAEPDDLSEWADMQFLLWDAQRRAGITDDQITQAMIEKLAVNKQREWPEPKDGEPRQNIKAQPAPVVQDGYVMVPMRLTAENGAKGALSGEFSEAKFVNCPECFGDDECETCDGSGRIEITVPVTWTTIKAIWVKGVEHFAVTAQEND